MTVYCRQGFDLNGDEILVCSEDGWLGHIPTCSEQNQGRNLLKALRSYLCACRLLKNEQLPYYTFCPIDMIDLGTRAKCGFKSKICI